ncbi:MAG: GTPase HflX [Chitinophagales bacterium]|nr:GTPase HflX [Chitinophagales bacterium]MDW8393181.1 GTPase HflX [Chitinophagales bacterium]
MLQKLPGTNGQEQAVLVGVVLPHQREEEIAENLSELQFLAETAGAITLKKFIQRLPAPDPRTFIGSGKVQELREYIQRKKADLVVFDDDLSGTQLHGLERDLKVKILDRSTLILDIFARRARTAQAKAQVELAQLQYLLPRLKGLWTHLERQRGGIGMRGPGEKEIETDRRQVKHQISLLKKQLERIDRQSRTQRQARGELIRVALVGYTNVGKSTLMNALSKAGVFAENKLFATLDTTTRKVVIGRMPFLLSDTVGFIRKLPHHLIESFKSTLDEVREADLLLHVVDLPHPNFEEQIKTVNQTLLELGAEQKKNLMVFNKLDVYEQQLKDPLVPADVHQELLEHLKVSWMRRFNGRAVFVSAATGKGLDDLRQKLFDEVKSLYLARYPYKAELF